MPCYNNASTIRAVVEGALVHGHKVLVVDDGSSDGEGLPLVGLDVELIRFDRNRGKGAAIRAALDFASEGAYTHIITIDADGQHDPADIPRFIDAAQSDPDALIVGHRDMEAGGAPPSSIFGRRFSNFWFRLQTGQSISDSQSGYRVYPVRHMLSLRMKGRRYEFETEALVRSAWAGLPVTSIPISVHYDPKDKRVTHFRRFWDNARISWLNTKLCARRLLPLPHRKLVDSPSLHQIMMGLILHPRRTLKAVVRENASPVGLAFSGAMGVVIGSWPIFGAHCITIVYIATRLNFNKIVALATQNICMPPLVPVICIEVGYFLLRGRWLTKIDSWEAARVIFLNEAHLRLLEWGIGSLFVGPLLGAVVGAIIYRGATAMQRKAPRAES